MKISKTTNYRLQFDNETLCDVYLASTLYKYILEKDDNLEMYVGFSSDDNPNGNHDFLYSDLSVNSKVIKEIEKHIKEFLTDFELIFETLESQCEDEIITDDIEFYEQFKNLSKVFKEKNSLESELKNNGEKSKKIKI
jgi:hypothetical protein